MVIDQAPAMSVVVIKRLPVSVFCAVIVTPGRERLPLFTTPCSFPPAASADGDAGAPGGCAVGAAGAAWGGGTGCAGEAGACAPAHAAAIHKPINTTHKPARWRIHSPVFPVFKETARATGRFTG